MDPLSIIIGVAAGLACGLIFYFIRAKSLRGTAEAPKSAEEIAAEKAEQDKQIAKSVAAKLDTQLAVEQERIEAELTERFKERAAKHRKTLEADFAEEKIVLDERAEKIKRREESLTSREDKFHNREVKLDDKIAKVDDKESKIDKREQEVEHWNDELGQRAQNLEEQEVAVTQRLAEVSGMSQDEAKTEFFKQLDVELVEEQNALIRTRRLEAEERAKEMGNEIVSRAIQRYSAEHTAETTTSKVELPDEEMKGRIIGREGRNIRSFEQATGVDLIIDDTPNVITISCFDGVRREIARRCLATLIEDGRIQPARIEEVLIATQQEMDREVAKLGEDAAYECDVSGLHPKLIKLLGKLQYRTSYGQNVLQHTKEVAWLSGGMAADLGLDPKLGRRCGLMHDIGKALDHEEEGSHPVLGFEALKRFNESEVVANAALAHHEGFEVKSIYTTIAAAADAISAARPGARRENVERYIKRLQQLEEIAISFKGVMKAYAIQAGRELRVIVNNHSLSDKELSKHARDIAKRIEGEVAYPGEVKVTMIRETRATATAR